MYVNLFKYCIMVNSLHFSPWLSITRVNSRFGWSNTYSGLNGGCLPCGPPARLTGDLVGDLKNNGNIFNAWNSFTYVLNSKYQKKNLKTWWTVNVDLHLTYCQFLQSVSFYVFQSLFLDSLVTKRETSLLSIKQGTLNVCWVIFQRTHREVDEERLREDRLL